jgi:hypothetical protein
MLATDKQGQTQINTEQVRRLPSTCVRLPVASICLRLSG